MTNGSASLPRENQQWSLHEGAQAKRGSLSDESRLRSICGKEEGTAITQFSAPTSSTRSSDPCRLCRDLDVSVESSIARFKRRIIHDESRSKGTKRDLFSMRGARKD